ncbi:MAG TPA: DUF1648 domain-containing protein [Candidatus Angelobacter sp.]|jgi:uncharacterized membrane protein
MIAKLAISVIWTLAAALLLRLLRVWDELPERVAVHFGISMQPNGWSRRSTMALLVVLVVVGHAALATWMILTLGPAGGIAAAIHLVTATVFFSVFWQMITFNIEGKPLKAIWIILPVLLVVGSIAALLSGTLLRHPVR